MFLPFLGLVVALGVFGVIMWKRHDAAKSMIQGDLAGEHATDIQIEIDLFDCNRDTFSYDVTYTDATGRRMSNAAKVAVRPGANGAVFWQQPLGDKLSARSS